MSYNRKELTDILIRLKGNAAFDQYVSMLEAHFNQRVNQLLDSDHPDEALRGECRALRNILKNINTNSGELT
jgi:hypothetical protein